MNPVGSYYVKIVFLTSYYKAQLDATHTKISSKFDSIEESFSVPAMDQIRTEGCVLRNGTIL